LITSLKESSAAQPSFLAFPFYCLLKEKNAKILLRQARLPNEDKVFLILKSKRIGDEFYVLIPCLFSVVAQKTNEESFIFTKFVWSEFRRHRRR
jgi:hypothetical protein